MESPAKDWSKLLTQPPRVARNGADLDDAMGWLKSVAGYGMQLVAEGRVEEARVN